jgi:hypothetical protein
VLTPHSSAVNVGFSLRLPERPYQRRQAAAGEPFAGG